MKWPKYFLLVHREWILLLCCVVLLNTAGMTGMLFNAWLASSFFNWVTMLRTTNTRSHRCISHPPPTLITERKSNIKYDLCDRLLNVEPNLCCALCLPLIKLWKTKEWRAGGRFSLFRTNKGLKKSRIYNPIIQHKHCLFGLSYKLC